MPSCLIWQPCMWRALDVAPWTWSSGQMSMASASGLVTCCRLSIECKSQHPGQCHATCPHAHVQWPTSGPHSLNMVPYLDARKSRGPIWLCICCGLSMLLKEHLSSNHTWCRLVQASAETAAGGWPEDSPRGPCPCERHPNRALPAAQLRPDQHDAAGGRLHCRLHPSGELMGSALLKRKATCK